MILVLRVKIRILKIQNYRAENFLLFDQFMLLILLIMHGA